MDFQFGDILGFWGRDLLCKAIETVTRGPSHVGIVAGHPGVVSHPPILWESTSLCYEPDLLTGEQISGVQTHDPQNRVANYDGPVYLYRLVPSWTLSTAEENLLTKFLNNHKGGKYDFKCAGISGTRVFKFLRHAYPNPSAWFCSELCSAALQRLGRFPNVNPSYINPANLIRGVMSLGRYSGPHLVVRFPYKEILDSLSPIPEKIPPSPPFAKT